MHQINSFNMHQISSFNMKKGAQLNKLSNLFRKEAENRRALIKQLKSDLEKYPPGNLHINKCRNTTQYYMSFDANGSKRKYIAKSQIGFIRSLAQRSYCRRLLSTSQIELEVLEKLIRRLPKVEIADLYYNLPPERQKLITPMYLSDEDYAKSWQSVPYNGLEIRENTLTYPTKRGELVRSKSEVIIANLLYEYGIPYKYECPVYLEGLGNVYPDFTILNIHTREIIYWEHFGMMDDPEYAKKSLDKILLYELNDIFPGKNLIISHEASTKPLNIEIIKKMILVYILQPNSEIE